MRPAIAYKGGAMSKKPAHGLREDAEIERWTSLVLYWRLVEGLSMADAWEAANEEAELLGPVVLPAVPRPPPSHVRSLEGIRRDTESPMARRVRIDDEHAKRRLEGVKYERLTQRGRGDGGAPRWRVWCPSCREPRVIVGFPKAVRAHPLCRECVHPHAGDFKAREGT